MRTYKRKFRVNKKSRKNRKYRKRKGVKNMLGGASSQMLETRDTAIISDEFNVIRRNINELRRQREAQSNNATEISRINSRLIELDADLQRLLRELGLGSPGEREISLQSEINTLRTQLQSYQNQ
jgi:hypothetical protein